MKKVFASSLILTAYLILGNGSTSYVNAESFNLNNQIRLGEEFNVFPTTTPIQERDQEQIQDRDKIQLRLGADNKFMIKGNITAYSSNQITIDNKVININSSVTGNIITAGTIQTGAYAMVQGIIQNSNYYATKIIVDQRNKGENNENVTTTPTITPNPTGTITPTPTITLAVTPAATSEAALEESQQGGVNMGTILTSLENVLSYLRNFVFNFH